MANNTIGVSVCCIVYNHGKYLRKTLDGFVSQETDFPFEVIIHDDASTDDSADIIKEYALLYPDIIRPILQSVNIYSKGISIIDNYIVPVIRGKYVAVCEGDDYWIDIHKLQKQYDLMEKTPESCFCVHRVKTVDENCNELSRCIPEGDYESQLFNSNQFIAFCRKYSFQTSSYFFRTDEYIKYRLNRPTFAKTCPVGDMPAMLYFGNLGPVCYINDIMSCYRRGVPASVTVNNAKSNPIQKIFYYYRMKKSFQEFDLYSRMKYHKICIERISTYYASESILSCRCYSLLVDKEMLRALSFKQKLIILLGTFFPRTVRLAYLSHMQKLNKKNGVIQ